MTQYFTLTEAMKIMKMSRTTIIKLIKHNDLEAFRTPGYRGTYRITQKQIDKCLQKNKPDPTG